MTISLVPLVFTVQSGLVKKLTQKRKSLKNEVVLLWPGLGKLT